MKTRPNAAAALARCSLSPQQEQELVIYIEKCTRRRLPPTREMVQNFAGSIGKCAVSQRWVSRFLHRHKDAITLKWSARIDRQRHLADSPFKYRLYFDMLHSRMQYYEIRPENTYNMDEKGFFVGVAKPSKRVFTKALWASKEARATVQDGNREWITLLACVCASGEALPPALIYQGVSGIQSAWVEAVEAQKHQVFFSNSASGWTNDEIGLFWLQNVFERFTREKAARDYRLLILDGHGSHVTREFIEYCDSHRILLSVFPPHATHSLQPLDVVVFAPLAKHYSSELDRHLQRSLGLTRVSKQDFFAIFWAAWGTTMREDLIVRSFEATGVWPMDAEVVLKRFNSTTSQRDRSPQIGENGDGDSWNELRKFWAVAVSERSSSEAKRLRVALHGLQTQNELLHAENEALTTALLARNKRTKQSKTLGLFQDTWNQGGAQFWSPRSLAAAREREAAKQNEAEQVRLQKTRDRGIKTAATAYKKSYARRVKGAATT